MIFVLYHLTGNTLIFSTLLETDRKFLYKFHQNSTQAPERRPAHRACLLIWYQVSHISKVTIALLSDVTWKLHLILQIPYRTGFQQFLRRPDHKQNFVSQWQADFNSLPDDLWEDEETKAELHQRVNVRESVTCWARVATLSYLVVKKPNPSPSYLLGWEDEEGNGLNTYLPTFKSNGSSALWVPNGNMVADAILFQCPCSGRSQGQHRSILGTCCVDSLPLCWVM